MVEVNVVMTQVEVAATVGVSISVVFCHERNNPPSLNFSISHLSLIPFTIL